MKKIDRLLVANRGEIARRIFRTAHRMGMETVAVYSDADAQALHVREATRSHALGGLTSAESYLDIGKILAAAEATGADAIHPGYGFLSENAEFAQAVKDAGLIWVGPPAEAIRALGSKAAVKDLAAALGVPCLPGYQGEEQSDEVLLAEAGRLGYPLMVKASAGGGGRGMRLVTEAAQLRPALASARSEAEAAFGDGRLLLERALLAPRHVEVQVFADTHGACIHLGERDCSVQRRQQKIIEETPSPAVDAALRARMTECAVSLTQAAGYVGAGTVEFLLEGDAFYLMEMNTRLQVEHPVTEAVTGLDLVEWQLRVAQGEPLPLAQEAVRFEGHAIEVRLCAEDYHFIPSAGRVQRFDPPEGVRFDHALAAGLEVPPYYDSMLGKLIAHAPTRTQAIEQLAGALDRLRVLGLPTNRRFLAACLRHPVFAAGDALILFLGAHGNTLRRELEAEEKRVLREAALSALLPQGSAPALASPFIRPLRLRHRKALIELPLDESQGPLRGHGQAVRLPDGRWHVQVGAIDLFLEDASFQPPAGAGGGAGSNELRAPFNGKVIAVHAREGQPVKQGDPLVVIESMKLEHAQTAPRDAVIAATTVEPGQQVATGQVLMRFEARA
ncbi:biotin carboxylase N-terminal domain-containing protein [Ramlibacter sp.]|uniref:ATP-binding protein n=1 Tax=Ramlibacter sp. TaxID=1917967 RepID=UPI0035AFEEA3